MRSLDERLHEAELTLARRKQQQRQSLTRQKIIIGGAILSAALKEPVAAKQLADLLRAKVARGPDMKAVAPVLTRLDEIVGADQPEAPDGSDPAPLSDADFSSPAAATGADQVRPPDIDLSNVSRRPTRRHRFF